MIEDEDERMGEQGRKDFMLSKHHMAGVTSNFMRNTTF